MDSPDLERRCWRSGVWWPPSLKRQACQPGAVLSLSASLSHQSSIPTSYAWKGGSFGLFRRGTGCVNFPNPGVFSLSTVHSYSRLFLGMTYKLGAMPTVIIFNLHFGPIQTPKSKIYHILRSISGSSSRTSRMCSSNKVCPQRNNVDRG